jgi:uncharacterized membrane protein HdeD (DUF308 family)
MAQTFLKSIRSTIKNWYIPLIIGILLVILGMYVMTTPIESYLALSFLFSWSFLLSGILHIIFAVNNKDEMDNWGWQLAGGILYTIFGLFLIVNIEVSIATLPLVVGFYVLFYSISSLGAAFDLRNYGAENWGWVAAFSILGLIFGFVLLWNPVFAGLSLVIWTAISIITAGFAAIITSFQLKRLKDLAKKVPTDLRDKMEKLRTEYYEAMRRK